MCPVMERFPLLWKLRKDFDAQHLEKGLNRGGQIFGAFFLKKCHFLLISDEKSEKTNESIMKKSLNGQIDQRTNEPTNELTQVKL